MANIYSELSRTVLLLLSLAAVSLCLHEEGFIALLEGRCRDMQDFAEANKEMAKALMNDAVDGKLCQQLGQELLDFDSCPSDAAITACIDDQRPYFARYLHPCWQVFQEDVGCQAYLDEVMEAYDAGEIRMYWPRCETEERKYICGFAVAMDEEMECSPPGRYCKTQS